MDIEAARMLSLRDDPVINSRFLKEQSGAILLGAPPWKLAFGPGRYFFCCGKKYDKFVPSFTPSLPSPPTFLLGGEVIQKIDANFVPSLASPPKFLRGGKIVCKFDANYGPSQHLS